MIYPDEKKFLELAKEGNLIPIGREFPADEETPVSAYSKLSGQPGGAAFLLESAETGGEVGPLFFRGIEADGGDGISRGACARNEIEWGGGGEGTEES